MLSTSIKECIKQSGSKAKVVTSLKRNEPEQLTMRQAIGGLYVSNCLLDYTKTQPTGQYVKLPLYPWQREIYWHESEESIHDRLAAPAHPLLGERLKLADTGHVTWESTLNTNFLPYLPDHQIEGLAVLPGAAYLEIGLAIHFNQSGKATCALEDIELHRALVLEQLDEPVLHTHYNKETNEYTIYSRSRDDKNNWTSHATGSLSMLQINPANRIDLNAIQASCNLILNSETLYTDFRSMGLQYGAWFQGIKVLYKNDHEVLAQLQGHPNLTTAQSTYRLHPTILDAAFQTLLSILEGATTPYIPVFIHQLRFHTSPGAACWCYGRMRKSTPKFIEADLVLCDDQGNVLIEVDRLRCQALMANKGEQLDAWNQWLCEFVWQPIELLPLQEKCSGHWLLFTDTKNTDDKLAQYLNANGARVTQVAMGANYTCENSERYLIRRDNKEDLQQLFTKLTTVDAITHVVYLWGLDAPIQADDPVGIADTITYLSVLQILANIPEPVLHLSLITRGAQTIGDAQHMALAQTPLVGLAREIINEHPNLNCCLIDLDPQSDFDAALLVSQLLHESVDEEIAFRNGTVFAHRFITTAAREQEPIAVTTESAYILENANLGTTDNLRLREVARRAPAQDEIEIEIFSTLLDIKDFFKVTKTIPDEDAEESFYGDSLGREAAGIVRRVGPNVTTYRVGDEVVVSMPDAFSAYRTINLNSAFIVPKPGNMNFDEAAGLSRIFVIAYYGVHYLARLQAGEKILIHAATHDVGLAAIQIAQWIGAEIFATADSEEKKAYLRSLGVQHVMDFRELDFSDRIMKLTNGNGVDVIFSRLPGEIVMKNLSILSTFGRYVELSKVWESKNYKHLPLQSFNRRNISFSVIYFGRLLKERPQLFKQLLQEVWSHFMIRDFKPLPTRRFAATDIVNAFNYIGALQHIGKVTVAMRDMDAKILPMPLENNLFRHDASYLITGGFGGLGLESAKWMAGLGAKNLILVGRRGAATEEARHTVQVLEQAGVKILVAAADMGHASDVACLMQEIGAAMPPLKGVFHAAGVLDDRWLVDQDAESFYKVMNPKALGAWYLHCHTRELNLDYFVLFSSIASQIGHPRQGNYVAANTYLDSLSHYRRACGLAATSVNWGAIAEVGMAVRGNVGEYLDSMGVKSILPSQAMRALGYVLHWQPIQQSVIRVDWAKLGQVNSVLASSLRFKHLLQAEDQSDQDSPIVKLRRELTDMEQTAREEYLAALIAALVSNVLRIPSDRVDLQQSLPNMGMDSLTSVELEVALQRALGIKVTQLELLKGTTIAQMAGKFLIKMGLAI